MTHGIVKDIEAEIGDGRDTFQMEDTEELECGCRVVCDTLPIILISCSVERCVYWKWLQNHSGCGGSKKCFVKMRDL